MHTQAVKIHFCPEYHSAESSCLRKAAWKNMDGVCMNPETHKPHRENLNGNDGLAGMAQDCLVVAVAWSYPPD